MIKETLQFILFFWAGMLWYRLLFFLAPIYFKRPLTRSFLKLQWHHLHWGVVLVLLAAVLLLFSGKSTIVIILLGLGLGFIMDLFIPSLFLETDREKELLVYKRSFIPTLLLFLFIIAIVIFIFLFK